jgi:hypothetical protein
VSPQFAGVVRMKNEADIIESFVRHHARLLDQLVVIDNGSCDASLAIVQRLADEGLPITLLDDDVIAYHQSEVMTYYSRMIFARFNCDRLFLLDADEFLKVGSRAELEQRIASISHDTHGLIPWMTYAPSADDDASEANPVARIAHRHAEEPQRFKLVLAQVFAHQADAVIIQGNHDLRSAYATCRRTPIADLQLAHFPVRSIRQIQSKAVAGWTAYIALGGEDRGQGYQWKALYEKLRRDPVWAPDDLYEIGANYPELAGPRRAALVHDPFPFTEALRYADAEALDPLQVALDSARDVARLYTAACRARDESAPTLARVQEDLDCLRRDTAAQQHDRQTLHDLVNVTMQQIEDLESGRVIRAAVALTMFWRRLRGRLVRGTVRTRRTQEPGITLQASAEEFP